MSRRDPIFGSIGQGPCLVSVANIPGMVPGPHQLSHVVPAYGVSLNKIHNTKSSFDFAFSFSNTSLYGYHNGDVEHKCQ